MVWEEEKNLSSVVLSIGGVFMVCLRVGLGFCVEVPLRGE